MTGVATGGPPTARCRWWSEAPACQWHILFTRRDLIREHRDDGHVLDSFHVHVDQRPTHPLRICGSGGGFSATPEQERKTEPGACD